MRHAVKRFVREQLNIRHRIALVVAVMTVPLVVTAGMLLYVKATDAGDTAKERMGVAYLAPLREIRERLPVYRRLVDAGADAATLTQARAAVEAAIGRLDHVDRRVGPSLDSTEDFARVRSEWDRYRANLPDARLAQDSYARLDQNLRALNLLVGDSSNLVLDPELDSYYLMDAVLLTLPRADALLNEIIDAVAPAPPKTTGPEPRSPEVIAALLQETLLSITADFKVATGFNVSLSGALTPVAQEYQSSLSAALAALGDPAGRRAVTGEALAARARTALAANYKLFDATLPVLDQLLERRIRGLRRIQITVVAIVVLGVLASSALAVWAARGATPAVPIAVEAATNGSIAEEPVDGELIAENQRLKILVAELVMESRSHRDDD